jgi:enamine deaminase RidA (YjgF/YER057c/UK114 family)
VPWVKSGNLVFIAGQLPFKEGKVAFVGRVTSAATGAEAAKLCTINLLSQLRDACSGNLDNVKQITKITGFVAANNQAVVISQVVNGASDFLVEVFGARGKHARSSVGVSELPLNATVEIEALVEII